MKVFIFMVLSAAVIYLSSATNSEEQWKQYKVRAILTKIKKNKFIMYHKISIRFNTKETTKLMKIRRGLKFSKTHWNKSKNTMINLRKEKLILRQH